MRKIADIQPRLARISEAARALNISRASLYKMIGEGTVPARKIGQAVRVPWSWIDLQTNLTEAERAAL